MSNNEEIPPETISKIEDYSKIVAMKDGVRGCPERIFDGPYVMRCGLGINVCARHGQFPVKFKD